MKQMEITRKEYINRLKKELDSVEGRYQQIINENCMHGEDYRSWAYENMQREVKHSRTIAKLKVVISEKDSLIEEHLGTIVERNKEIEQEMMRNEEYTV